jgi:hypothetical protein
MNVVLIVILILTVSLVLGPVMMMRPNSDQKNKENLRILARAKGVHYSMRNIPQQADEQAAPEPSPVYFSAPSETQSTPSWMLVRTGYEHEIHFLGWWAWQGEARATAAEMAVLTDHLQALPESVRALSAGGKGVSVYWAEKGGEPVLRQILDLIALLKKTATNPN